MANQVTVIGLDDFNRDWDRLTVSLDDALADLAATEARSVADKGALAVPIISGALAASIDTDELTGGEVGSQVYSDIEYFGPVEYGGWPPGRPYISEGRYIGPLTATVEGSMDRLFDQAVSRTVTGFDWSHPAP